MKLTQEIYNTTEVQNVSYSPSNPKIDFYFDGKYTGSTNYYRTVRQALKGKADKMSLNIGMFGRLSAIKAIN